jgi:hypothetical protein
VRRLGFAVATAAAAAVVATLPATTPPARAWDGQIVEQQQKANHRFIDLSLYEIDVERRKLSKAAGDPADPPIEFENAYACGVDSGALSASDVPCGPRNDPVIPPDCGDDEPVKPLWSRERGADGTWGPWQMAYGWTCPADHLPPFTAADFRRLPLAKPALTMQPDAGWVLVNMPTIVYSADKSQTLRTSLLGHPVTVRATPTAWTWDYGEGRPSTTRSPGHPYPDQDVWHTYTRLGTYRIGLTVTWSAQYRYDEQPTWHDVDGTATTTAATGSFTVEERRGHLVAETCDQDPTAPGC